MAVNKKRSASKTILTILICVFVCAFLFSAYKLYSIYHDYNVSRKKYDNLSTSYVSEYTPSSAAVTSFPAESIVSSDTGKEIVLDPEVSPITIDFDALLAECDDIVGWLYQPGTVINYPVVQGEDNFYYLHKFIDGYYSGGGTLYIDVGCEADFTSKNTILYGHNMNDGSMLASICNYKYQDYYNEHPVMYLNTPGMNFRIELFSGYITPPETDSYKIDFEDDLRFHEFLLDAVSKSTFTSNVFLSPDDNVITFSTCTYEYDDVRYVVLGKLVPIH